MLMRSCHSIMIVLKNGFFPYFFYVKKNYCQFIKVTFDLVLELSFTNFYYRQISSCT